MTCFSFYLEVLELFVAADVGAVQGISGRCGGLRSFLLGILGTAHGVLQQHGREQQKSARMCVNVFPLAIVASGTRSSAYWYCYCPCLRDREGGDGVRLSFHQHLLSQFFHRRHEELFLILFDQLNGNYVHDLRLR